MKIILLLCLISLLRIVSGYGRNTTNNHYADSQGILSVNTTNSTIDASYNSTGISFNNTGNGAHSNHTLQSSNNTINMEGGHRSRERSDKPVFTNRHRATPEKMLVAACQAAANYYNYSNVPPKKKQGFGHGHEITAIHNGTVSNSTSSGSTKKGSKKEAAKQTCEYAPFYGSFALCLHRNAPSDAMIEKAMPAIINNCPGMTLDKLNAVYDNATKYALHEYEITPKDKINRPVSIGKETYDKFYKSSIVKPLNYDRSVLYGIAVLGYWTGIMVFSAIFRFLTACGLVKLLNNCVTKYLQRKLFIASLFDEKHMQTSRFFGIITAYIPTMAESCVIFGYLVTHIIVLSINWEFVPNSPKGLQIARYLADRTGIIAFAHFPLIFLFAGRNNFLQWLTGFSFSTFIQFHKWTGRIMFVDAMIHSILFTVIFVANGRYSTSLHTEYFYWGIVATVVCAALMIQSYNWFRRHCYEIFLYGHIVLAVVFLVGVYKHCVQLGYMEFVYASIAIWAFDRLVRLFRILQFGIKKATIKIVSQDTMKVTVKSPDSWKAHPGQFVYIYFFKGSAFYQSHPFTVNHVDNEINIYIKAKKGTTKQIFDLVAKKPDQMDSSISVGIEGPYGHSAPNYQYDHINLVAGGNGIPGPFDHALKLARKYPEGQKDIKLLWIAKDLNSIAWFAEELQLLQNTPVQVFLFLTRESPANIITSQQQLDQEKDDDLKFHIIVNSDTLFIAQKLKDFTISCQRPDLNHIVRDWLTHNKGSVSITSCGPNIMCDQLRKHIASYVEDHNGRVDYYEELQTW